MWVSKKARKNCETSRWTLWREGKEKKTSGVMNIYEVNWRGSFSAENGPLQWKKYELCMGATSLFALNNWKQRMAQSLFKTCSWKNTNVNKNVLDFYRGSPSQGSEHPGMLRSHFAPPTFSSTSWYKPDSDSWNRFRNWFSKQSTQKIQNLPAKTGFRFLKNLKLVYTLK